MVYKNLWNPHAELMRREDIEKIQLRGLKATLKRVYENVPFYRRLYKEAGVTPNAIRQLSDITKLPFTTKDHVRQGYPYKLLAVPLSEVVEFHASSGTSGTPTVTAYTVNDIEVWGELMARCEVMSGLTKEDVFQITPGFGMFVGGFGMFYGARKVGAAIVPFGPGFSRRQIQTMVDYGTTMIGSIFSYMLRLAEVAFEMGIDPARDTKVRKGIAGAEQWTPALRRRINKVWDMDLYDVWGFTEACGNGVSNDCYLHDGLHLWEDHFIIEVIDPKTGDPVEPEEEGEIVLTSLDKEAYPIIRYRVRDIAFIYDSLACECGRTHRRHSAIKARTDDMKKVKGVNVWPTEVEHVVAKHEDLKAEYQLVLERAAGADKLTIKVEAANKLDEEQRAELAKKLTVELTDVLLISPDVVEILDPGGLGREVGKPRRMVDLRN